MTPSRDSPARWALYERHLPAIRAYAVRRVEPDAVDDVVAETFAIAWRKLPRVDDPLPWLYGTARNLVLAEARHSAPAAPAAATAGAAGRPASAATRAAGRSCRRARASRTGC